MEIARLAAVVPALKTRARRISIDSFSPEVQRWALAQGVDYLNDIHGFPDPALYPALAASRAKLIVMHSVQERGVATRVDVPPVEIFDRIRAFFEPRIAALTEAGIARERLILDPGMGFFLGSDPENSFTVLRRLPELKRASACRCWSRSRVNLSCGKSPGRAAAEAGPASLCRRAFRRRPGGGLTSAPTIRPP